MADTMTVPTNKAELLAYAEERWRAFVAYTNGLSEAEWTSPTDAAGWSVKDHVAHVVRWVRTETALLRDRTPLPQILGLPDAVWDTGNLDAINAAIRQQMIGDSPAAVRAERDRVFPRFVEVVSRLSDDDLVRPANDFGFDEPGKSLLAVLTFDDGEHFEEHRGYIETIVAQARRSARNGGDTMDQTLFTLPILPGKTEAARDFLQELHGPRKQELAACGQSVGIVKEVWAIQQTPRGDMYVAYMAGEDLAHAFKEFAASQSAFDCWFKQQVQATTGADLNTPPPGPISEILVDTAA